MIPQRTSALQAESPLRVLHIGKYFPPAAGGIERFLGELVAEQRANGLHCSVLVHDKASAGTDRFESGTLHRTRAFGEWLFVPISPQWPWALSAAIAESRPDLLHIHMPNPWAFLALLSPAARAIPWIVHWHADIPLDHPSWRMRLAYRPYAWFERRLLLRAARIVASSHTYAEASHAIAPFKAKCDVIPLGMGAAPLSGDTPAWPNSRDLKLLAVGRLSYYKGFQTLLKALTLIEGVQLLLIGDGDQRDSLASLISTHGLADRVRLAGHLSDGEIEAAYQACDVFCLPSIDRAEAFGLVLLEAMRAGKPVVSSAVPGSGMCEVVADGDTGIQVPPSDPAVLARVLADLRDHEDKRLRLGTAGRARFNQQYRLQPVADQIEKLYRKLVPAR